MQFVPREIANYLVENEVLERDYKLRDGIVYITSKRLLIKQGDMISPFAYSRIKSIKCKNCRRYIMLSGGIFLIIMAIVIMQILNFLWWNPPVSGLILLGGLLIGTGFVPKKRIELGVTGRSSSLVLSTKEEHEIDPLTRLIGERIT